MGIQFGVVQLPQTEGVIEYFVTDVISEALPGGAIRFYCGVRRGGVVHWLYTAVMQAEDALKLNVNARDTALASLENLNGCHC